MRSWPYQRHVAVQNIDELGQLVDIPFAEKMANRRDPLVTFGRLTHVQTIFGCRHRPKLNDPEHLLIEAVAALQKKHRTGAAELDEYSDDDEQRRENE